MPPRSRIVTRSQASNQENGDEVREPVGSEFDVVIHSEKENEIADANRLEDDAHGNGRESEHDSEEQPATHFDENHSLPRLEAMAEKQLQIIKNLTYKKLRKEDAIQMLEINIDEETPPHSLRINVKVSVTPPQQEEMDDIVRDAVWKCQKIIMEGILDARNAELAQLNEHMEDAKAELLRKKNHMMHLMAVRNATIHAEVVNRVMDKFKKDVRHTINEAKQADILKKYHKDEKERAEEEVERALEDPAMRRLKKDLSALQNTVKKLQGNGKAKPGGKKDPGGGLLKADKDKGKAAAAKNNKKQPQQQKKKKKQDQQQPKKGKAPQNKAQGEKRNENPNARRGAARAKKN